MRLLLDDDLVEGAVHHCATRTRRIEPAAIRRFHQARESAYRRLDPDERQEAFAAVHLAFFREWGLEAHLESVLGRFDIVHREVGTAVFRKARVRGEEGADLYVNPEGERRAIVALVPERLESAEVLEPLLHHEWQHVSDMVDPAFGYRADLDTQGESVSQQRLVAERYRLLWDVVIDGRLCRRGLSTVGTKAGRQSEFLRAFGFLPDAAARFDAWWEEDRPRHEALLDLARDPRAVRGVHGPVPGGPCPLCGFATFEWMVAAELPPTGRERIRREFPGWCEDEGLCRRCGEVYQATLGADLAESLRL